MLKIVLHFRQWLLFINLDSNLLMCYYCGMITTMKKTEIAYYAGLFDGEGCISIRLNRPTETSKHKTSLYSLVTKVTMCDESLIKELHRKFKFGHVVVNQNIASLGLKRRPAWSWTCMSKEAAQVVQILSPYLKSKAREAMIALEFMKLPSSRHGKRRTDNSLTLKREEYYLKLREAKGRL